MVGQNELLVHASMLVCLAISLFLNVVQYWTSERRERDLLNRLMARDWGEYKAMQSIRAREQKPPRNIPMTDEHEALIEMRKNREKEEAAIG